MDKCMKLLLLQFALIYCQDDLTEVHTTSDGSTSHPETMTLNFDLQGQPVTLNLQENKDIPNSVPIILANNGRRDNWQSANKTFTAYIDKQNNASFILQDGTYSGESTLKGTFRHENRDYMIEPAATSVRRRRSARENLYKITPLSMDDIHHSSEYRGNEFNTTFYLEEWMKFDNSIGSDLIKQNYEVETMMFIDYALFNRFYEASKQDTASSKRDEAISNIRYYYAHVANGISLRYQSIDYFDYSLSVRLVGIYIAMTPADSIWTTKLGTRYPGYPRDFSDAYNSLDDFEEWINQPHPDLPAFDQATLLTGNQLFRANNDGTRTLITGLADIGSVCGKLRASVCQDNGLYATTQTAAHEMGHNLGANHDGLGNGCSYQDQYIMASSPAELTDSNYKNAFTFSYCSKTYFREYILLLNLNHANCMLERGPTQYPQGEFDSQLLLLPGEKYSLDEQCQAVFGKESYYCGGHLKDLAVCRIMYCYNPGTRACFGRTEQRAASGTSCGNRKWCQDGDCIFSERAPEAVEFCRTGDFKGTFYDGRTCSSIVRNSPWDCYTEAYGGDCCKSCAAIANNSNPDCIYGDKGAFCARDVFSRDCYTEDTQKRCCKTCAGFHLDLPGCEYGDRAGWCSTIAASACYAQASDCCLTCSKLKRMDKPDCPYGDMVSWCSSQDSTQCYNTRIGQQCCDYCSRFQTGIPGCEFGDQSRYCTPDDCKDATRRRECCLTCGMRDPQTTATTTTTTTAKPTTSTVTSTPKSTVIFTSTIKSTPIGSTVSGDCKDRASWCANILQSDCYTASSTCCQTCSKFYAGTTDCQYGDKASWCKNYVKANGCGAHSVKSTCCNSCAVGAVSPVVPSIDCPLGDQASWCNNISPSQCYTPSTERTCCTTCAKYRQSIPGCKYGDMFTWCKPVYCVTNKQDCCQTCHV